MKLLSSEDKYWNKGFILFTDNWYTSLKLFLMCMIMCIALIGTVKTNSAGLPKEFLFPKTGKGQKERGELLMAFADISIDLVNKENVAKKSKAQQLADARRSRTASSRGRGGRMRVRGGRGNASSSSATSSSIQCHACVDAFLCIQVPPGGDYTNTCWFAFKLPRKTTNRGRLTFFVFFQFKSVFHESKTLPV